jgi:bacterioferritin-associated ferredoxin
MYVCICMAVNERRILQAMADGADTWAKLVRRLKIATQCGKCKSEAREFFLRELARTDVHRSLPDSPPDEGASSRSGTVSGAENPCPGCTGGTGSTTCGAHSEAKLEGQGGSLR